MRPHHDRRRSPVPQFGTAALLVLGGLACSDGPLGGPGLPGRGVSLRLEPRVEPRASVVAAGIARVRVAIARVPDGLVVLDSVVDLVGPSGAELDLAVPLASVNDRFAVRLAAADAAGDTIFRAADTTEVMRGPAAPSLELLLRYAGPDTGMARIAVGPDSTVADAGASVPLWAVGYRPGAGDATPLAHVAWHSADETVVRVSRTGGHATAVAPGRATWIYATTMTGLVDSARVVVRHLLAALDASPTALTLAPGATAQVAVAGRAPDGSALAADAVTWTSSDAAVAVVNVDGSVTAVGVGSATITAAGGGAQVAVPVTVRQPGVESIAVAPASLSLVRLERAQLAAAVALETGTAATDRPVIWTTSDASVATVDADGVVSAVGVGSATVTATAGGSSASVAVSVAPLPVDAIVASPTTVQLAAGESLLLAATVTDAAGQAVPNSAVTWTNASRSVATVSSAGLLSALAPGTTTVTASANGRTSTVAVTVLSVSVSDVVLSSGKFPLVVGGTHDLDATPLSVDGVPLRDRVVTWRSKWPSIATVDANGVVTAVAPGFTIVTATSEGVERSVKVDVVPIPVARVALSASVLSLLDGATFQLRADAYDSLDRLLPGRRVSWSTSDRDVARVAGDGLVTARKVGVVTVTATIEGRTATATVAVAPPVSSSVRFTSAAAAYAYGQTMSAQAVGISHGVGATTLQLASWNGSIASVQQTVTVTSTTPSTFTVTGRALGTTTLQATSAVASMGTTSIEVVSGRLRAEGWTGGSIPSGDYRRIRIHAGGVDGTATDAVFAEATSFTVLFDDRHLEVHRDGAPGKPVGPASSDDRASSSSISEGQRVTVPVGQPYLSLLVRGKNPGSAWLRLTGPSGKYVTLDLRDLRIEEDDD